jgi:hypothetical protein
VATESAREAQPEEAGHDEAPSQIGREPPAPFGFVGPETDLRAESARRLENRQD